MVRKVLSVIGVPLGLIASFVGASWVGFAGAGLAEVSLTRVDVVGPTTAPSPSWALFTVVNAAGLALLAGRSRVGRVDVVAALGGLWILGWLGITSVLGSGWELTGPDVDCVRPGCAPQGIEELLVGAPLAVAALALLTLGLVGARERVARAAPPLVYVVLAVLQVAVWDDVVVPALLG